MSKDKNINILGCGLALGVTCLTGAGLYFALSNHKSKSHRRKLTPKKSFSKNFETSRPKSPESMGELSRSFSSSDPETDEEEDEKLVLTEEEQKKISNVYEKKFLEMSKKIKIKDSNLIDVDLSTPPRKVSDDLYFKPPESPKKESLPSSDDEWCYVKNTPLNNSNQ